VEQRGVTIAVNFWHDMAIGPTLVLLRFLRALAVLPPSAEAAAAREAEEAERAAADAATTTGANSPGHHSNLQGN
jgi:hypothetical protein